MAQIIYDRAHGWKGKSEKSALRLSKDEIADEDFDEEDSVHGRWVVKPDWRDRNSGWPRTNPVKRWLHKQVGRPFDLIEGELKSIKLSAYPYHDLWEAVKYWIERNPQIVDGKLYNAHSYQWAGLTPVSGLYVDPRSGLLCLAPERRYRWNPKVDPNVTKISDTLSHEKLNGIWFAATYRMIDDPYPSPYYTKYDSARKAPQIREMVSKRQLNSRELREAGLKNG